MTVWGLSPFDDDDTVDFSYEFKRSGLPALARACNDARYSDSRLEQHAEGFAAAYIVSGILSQNADALSAKTLELKPTKELIDSAAAAVRVIRENGSDYLNGWAALGEDVYAQKLDQISQLLRVLSGDPEQKVAQGDVLEGSAPGERQIAPGSWNYQRFSNVQLLTIRNQMKDNVEVERDVDHSFVCGSEEIALAVIKQLEDKFSIDGPTFAKGEDSEPDCWTVVATTSYAPNFANTLGFSLLMFNVSNETGAEYDGWGAPIIKAKKSWFGRK